MKRRIAWVVLSGLLVVVTVSSLLFTPAATQGRLSAIPFYSHLVYNNESPEWFLSFFPNFGKNSNEFSKGWRKKLQILETRPLAVATVPFGGRGQRDTWVAVSELGGPAALVFRWRLLLFSPEEVSRARPYAGWPVWTFDHSSVPAWARVRFSITEGLLICSVSSDSHDIYRLLDTVDGRAKSLAD
ncbi:MAG: hypothetical protein OEL75_03740 [Kiritimatiellaceae bacterium]|nr:hypothetical protein [Kiritimatiellaceae bacterium]